MEAHPSRQAGRFLACISRSSSAGTRAALCCFVSSSFHLSAAHPALHHNTLTSKDISKQAQLLKPPLCNWVLQMGHSGCGGQHFLLQTFTSTTSRQNCLQDCWVCENEREAGCAVVGWSIEHVGRTESGDRAAQVLQSTFPRQHQAGTRQATILGWQARLSYWDPENPGQGGHFQPQDIEEKRLLSRTRTVFSRQQHPLQRILWKVVQESWDRLDPPHCGILPLYQRYPAPLPLPHVDK